MGRLRHELRASSLLECIVASVLWLGAFMVTMEILTRMMLKEQSPEEDLCAWVAVKRCFQDYSRGAFPSGNYTRTYDGGILEIELIPYRGKIQRLSIHVYPLRGRRDSRYDYLIKSENNEI